MPEKIQNGFCNHHYELVEKIMNAKNLFKWSLIIILAAMGFVAVFLYNAQATFQHQLINPKDGLLIEMNKKLDSHLASWPGPPQNHRDMPHQYERQPDQRTGR